MVQNKAFIFKQVPDGWPVAGQDLVTEDIGFDPEAAAPEGGLTIQLHSASFDPYMRGRMRSADKKSYNPPFELGKPIVSHSVGTVLKSNVASLQPGDLVRGVMPVAEYASVDGEWSKRISKLENPLGLDERYFIGPLGMPGQTAYSSLYEIGKPKRGETIFISAASGAVGQIVGQLAKHEGLTVIGSVGSQAKLDYITRDLGFDAGFNYKEEKPAEALARLAPQGVDIYYENVGGEQLEAALTAANPFARFIMCGMISQYSARPDELYGIKNLFLVVGKRITMRGFIVSDPGFADKHGADHLEKVSAWIKDGSFKVSLSTTKGIDNAAEGFIGMLRGDNFGKAVLDIKSS